MRSSPVRFFNIFTWIFIDVLLWGYTTKYLSTSVGSTFNFVAIFLGIILLWQFLSQVHRGFILAALEDVYTHNFVNLFSSPLRVHEYLTGLVLSAIFTSSVALFAVLLLSYVVFGFSILSFGALLIPVMLVMLIFGIVFGILASAVVLRLGPAGEWLAWPVAAFIAPFVGVFYPIGVLPAWMQTVGSMLPITYVFENVRTYILTGVYDAGAVYMSIVLSLVYLVVAYVAYYYVYRYAIKHGLIARFDAESV